MKKLMLDPETIAVESFAPAVNAVPVRGTVAGADATGNSTCPRTSYTCGANPFAPGDLRAMSLPCCA